MLGLDVGPARIKEIVADTSPNSMREREIKGKKEGHELDFIGPAKAQNWKQLQSSDDRDAIFILEEFARDAMQRRKFGRRFLRSQQATARGHPEK